MLTVELLFASDCPNVSAAREQLRRAFAEIGAAPKWIERDLTADDLPPHAQGYGSPTILVDGRDVAGDEAASGACCRLYTHSDHRGAPPVASIVAALCKPSGGDNSSA